MPVSLLFSFPLETWPTCPFLGSLAGCCGLLLCFPLSLGIFTSVLCLLPSRHLVPTVGVSACWIDFPVCLGWSQPHKWLTCLRTAPSSDSLCGVCFLVSPNTWISVACIANPAIPSHQGLLRVHKLPTGLRDLSWDTEHLSVEGRASAQSELREEISGRQWEETQL